MDYPTLKGVDMTGWVKIHRAIQAHKHWNRGPFSWGQAIVDLLLKANFKDTEWICGNTTIKIPRGSLVTSSENLQKDWNWSRQQVRGFLGGISDFATIKTTNRFTIISIINYDTYQDAQPLEQPTEQPSGNQRITNEQPHHKNDKKLKNEKKNTLPVKTFTLTFPDWVMADGEIVELLTEWINYRAAKNKKVSQVALNLNLKPYLNDTKRLKSALEATIARGWQGIFEDKSFSPVKGNYGAPTAVLNPDGTVSGEIDFNKLPANAKVGIMNQNVLKHFEEKERLENLNKKLEIANDNRSTDGKTLDRILRAVPQLGTKVRHSS